MKRNLAALTEGVHDLLILGGGITGAGVALDATLRGYRTALIDKGDFGSGTSSVSTKLVHGGLRYLEHGDVALVYEALHERRQLLANAPHLVRPLRFLLPYYRGARVPPWKWRLGLTLYDLLAGAGNLRRSRPVPLAALRREAPGLNPAGLCGGSAYYDAQMDDARLCLEVVLGAAEQGAAVANYVEMTAFERHRGQIVGVRARDQLSGQEFSLRARQVLNATGPWVDAICRAAGQSDAVHLRPTKGVHLVAPFRGLTAAFLLLHPEDGRVFFVLPWAGKTLVGTTDTVTDEGPDQLTVRAEEVDYLLRGHNHYFCPPLGQGEVLSGFAGLRPLIEDRPGTPSAQTREFRLFESPGGLLSVAGGKYTTYRRMAEQITDALADRLGRRGPCRTRDFPLTSAASVPWSEYRSAAVRSLQHDFSLGQVTATHLVDRYGGRATRVAAYLKQHPDLAQPVLAGEPELHAEFLYQREQEMAVYPADFLLRRTRLGLFAPHLLKAPPAVLGTSNEFTPGREL